MTVTSVPSGHFTGGRGINLAPTTGDDVRSLEDVLNEVIDGVNGASSSVTTPITSAATFPLLADVIEGTIYRVTTAATDNGGVLYTNTAQSFLAGDEIVWNGTNWTLLGHGVSTSVPAAIGVAAAGSAVDKANSDHVHAHGNQLGGTLHADAVAGVSSGFMTAAMATGLAAVVDDHVTARCAALDIKTDEIEVSAALSGDVAKTFVPTHIVLKVVTNVGALNADGTVNIGTAADGAQIAAAIALTGLTAVGATRVVPLPANTSTLVGNATVYANVEAAETGAGTLGLDVYVIGRQV